MQYIKNSRWILLVVLLGVWTYMLRYSRLNLQTLSRIMNPALRSSSCCPLLINLPSEIVIDILVRLPVRTILSCKCVCKELRNLLSAPEFVAYHLSLSKPGLLIRQVSANNDLCQVFEFEGKFDHNLYPNRVMKFDPKVSIGSSNARILLAGSVNGILCLWEERRKQYDAPYLCNPITREYIALPRIRGILGYPYISEYGFGVSRISGQYKVVANVFRYSRSHQHSPIDYNDSNIEYFECFVYTLGTRSWRMVQPGKPLGFSFPSFNLFLNGNLHGLQGCIAFGEKLLIYCFDLETESFMPFPSPPPPLQDSTPFGTLGILDDHLCFVYNSMRDPNALVIWVMKEYAVKESWTKQLVVGGSHHIVGKYDIIYLVKAFEDGDVFLSCDREVLFYFCNKTKACIELDLVALDRNAWTEAIPHNPSFLSLKIFEGENVEFF